jgi:selenide, water dikinase
MGPAALAHVLRHSALAQYGHPDLLVGLQTSDDAAVFRLSPEQAIIQTLDFFPPVVDDPYTYGAVAAANSMSDVYAMGGEVLLALNIVAFPADLPGEILGAILEGGAAKVAEAGGVVAGGHTVTDPEPKYGLCVTGVVHPERILTKAGARPGDRLFLTKPLGTGALTTAAKNGAADPAHIQGAIASMLTLNRAASRAARRVPIHAATDITGFGLLGHGSEVAAKSGVRLRLRAGAVPLLDGARDCALAGHLPGGLGRNRDHFADLPEAGVTVAPGVPPELVDLLYDPETSGPLLLAVAPDRAADLRAAFATADLPLWEIGGAESGAGVVVEP